MLTESLPCLIGSVRDGDLHVIGERNNRDILPDREVGLPRPISQTNYKVTFSGTGWVFAMISYVTCGLKSAGGKQGGESDLLALTRIGLTNCQRLTRQFHDSAFTVSPI